MGALVLLILSVNALAGDRNGGPGANDGRDRKGNDGHDRKENKGRRLFERETFGGNGRTCLTCHSRETGTLSPHDSRQRFLSDPSDPLFDHDGSDDGRGNGVERILSDATILVAIPLPPNVTLADDPAAPFVILRRGIPTTLNTPALDPVLMLDGRQPNLASQALGAIHDHAQNTVEPTQKELDLIAEFEQTDAFFSSRELRNFARGGRAPKLPQGRTRSEKRGRIFFEDVPPNGKEGLCAQCHAGPMLNETSETIADFVPPGTRFQSVLVSELNAAGNPTRVFIFTNPDGTKTEIESPDPGRALITGIADDPTFEHVNAFKIPTLRGVRNTAPYFHDNSSETLEDVAAHYAAFFGDNPTLTKQDQADIVAFLKLLD
jgi:cytochrome c peroxidase